MVLLLGASGYIGQAFANELKLRKFWLLPLSRAELDYTKFSVLLEFLQSRKPTFVINAAGHTGRPNVDACEDQKADTLQGNTLLPVTVAQACVAAGVPWAHISSGCIYSGGKVLRDGEWVVERNLNQPHLRELFRNEPDRFRGFVETDPSNFSFRSPPCSFYSGTKALAEEALASLEGGYIWRLRIPFDEFDNSRNYISKLLRYPRIYDNINSLSHRGDFARACLDLWQRQAPTGTYNVTNPGAVSATDAIKLIQEILRPQREFAFWSDDEEFYRLGARAPRSNCLLDVSKLLATGVRVRPVQEALREALATWQPEASQDSKATKAI
ncbi:MAG: sugar nucleotide-binding protein [Verrucomicrobia bacterium]|nr:sugar nucleotide-binding protein [Verrucomicrobiota bacterium]